jgi:hypothetical protein
MDVVVIAELLVKLQADFIAVGQEACAFSHVRTITGLKAIATLVKGHEMATKLNHLGCITKTQVCPKQYKPTSQHTANNDFNTHCIAQIIANTRQV